MLTLKFDNRLVRELPADPIRDGAPRQVHQAFSWVRPTPVVAPPAAAPMMAALSGEKGAVVAVSYDATSGKLTVAPTVLDRGRGDVELWIIPAGGTPRSLGVIDAQSVQTNAVSAASRSYVQPGATFAITQEVKGGSPSGQPAGPIVAAGKIIRT